MNSDKFGQATTAYAAWLKETGVWINDGVEITDLRNVGRGRGMIATSRLEANETLFRIPYTLLLCSFTSSCPNKLLCPLELNNKQRTHWFKQVLVLLYERALGSKSKWAPYIATLPLRFDTPIFWTTDEMKELQACGIVDQIGHEEMDSLFNEHLIPLVLASPSSFGFDANEKNLKDKIIHGLHISASTLMAYAFDLNKEDKEDEDMEDQEGEDDIQELEFPYVTSLVPPADILNADEEHNAQMHYEKDFLVMETTKTVEVGEEILNTYGPLDRSSALRRYGYITSQYAKNDFVILKATLLVDEAKRYYGVDQKHIDKWIRSQSDADDAESLESLYQNFDLELERDQASQLDVEGLEEFDLKELIPKSMRFRYTTPGDPNWWAHWLVQALSTKLGEYATNLDDDCDLLRLEGSTMDNRRKMAVEIRIGDKEILQGYLTQLKSLLTSSSDENERPQKRRRPN